MSLIAMSISASALHSRSRFLRSLLIHKAPKTTFSFFGVLHYSAAVPISVHSQFSIFTAVERLKQNVYRTKINSLTQSSPFQMELR